MLLEKKRRRDSENLEQKEKRQLSDWEGKQRRRESENPGYKEKRRASDMECHHRKRCETVRFEAAIVDVDSASGDLAGIAVEHICGSMNVRCKHCG